MSRVSGTLVTCLYISIIVILFFFVAQHEFRSFTAVTLHYGEVDTTPAVPVSLKKNVYFVGDIMLARDVERTLFREGLEYPYVNISFNEETDYVVANFEAAIPKTHVKTPNFTFRFSVDRRLLPPLRTAGFTHLSLSNNHAFDFGAAGFDSTKEALADNDFTYFGHPTIFSTSSVSFLHISEMKIAIIGLHLLFITPSDENLASVLSYARENSDLQVLYVHWGDEYSLLHSREQSKIAKKVSDLGVDIIVGHHPHVVQDIGKIGNTLIFYSLGNYIFDQYFSVPVMQGLVLKLNSELAIELLPVSSEESRVQPSFMEGEKRAIFLNDLAKRSDPALFEQIQSGVISYANMLATSTEVAIMAP